MHDCLYGDLLGRCTAANGNREIVVRLKIHPGYHIYAYVAESDPFVTTQVELQLPEGHPWPDSGVRRKHASHGSTLLATGYKAAPFGSKPLFEAEEPDGEARAEDHQRNGEEVSVAPVRYECRNWIYL